MGLCYGVFVLLWGSRTAVVFVSLGGSGGVWWQVLLIESVAECGPHMQAGMVAASPEPWEGICHVLQLLSVRGTL
jgi:hypothetical protein